jgi:acetyltransferase-like isoleucine patch superfamily enzyme
VLKNHEDQTSPKLIIGDHAAIGMDATISAAAKIIIEEYVFTARNVYISDHGHEFHDVSIPIASQGIRKIAPVLIGRHSWLGQNVVILPGVTIGRHCVIGANSVVTKDVPEYSVVAGAPARIIERFNKITSRWERPAAHE